MEYILLTSGFGLGVLISGYTVFLRAIGKQIDKFSRDVRRKYHRQYERGYKDGYERINDCN